MQTSTKDLSISFAKISQIFKSDSSYSQIIRESLQELAQTLHCDWGTYWKVSPQSQQLKPFLTWTKREFNAPDLRRDTKDRFLSLSEGTAGHVWRSKKPIWTLDLIQDMCLPRSLDADKSGLTGGIWFAVKTGDTVYAVIELLGRDVVPPSQKLILEIESFGIHLGSLLEKRLGDF